MSNPLIDAVNNLKLQLNETPFEIIKKEKIPKIEKNEEPVFATAKPSQPSQPSVEVMRLVTFLEVRYHYENEYPELKVLEMKFWDIDLNMLDFDEINRILVTKRNLPSLSSEASLKDLLKKPEPVYIRDEVDPEFLIASNMVCDPFDKRSISAKMKAIGKTSQWWNNQMKHSLQRELHKRRVDDTYGQIPELAKSSLTRLVESGDLQAVKYAEEKLNIYRPGELQTVDFLKIINQLMEILVKYVSKEALEEIAIHFEDVINVQSREIERT